MPLRDQHRQGRPPNSTWSSRADPAALLRRGRVRRSPTAPSTGRTANRRAGLLQDRRLPPRLDPDGHRRHQALGADNGFTVDATEDAAAFTTGNLARYEAVVFLNTTGDVLNAEQQAAFEGYIAAGGGYVGVHSAADTEYDWPWYGSLVGAYFDSHPAIQPATVRVEDRAHAATAHLGDDLDPHRRVVQLPHQPPRHRPRPGHPRRDQLHRRHHERRPPDRLVPDYDGGRSFYTGLGHTPETYAEPDFLSHLLGGIRYAAGDVEADCSPDSGYTPLFDGTSTDGWYQAGPGSFTLGQDGTLTSQGGMGLLWYEAAAVRLLLAQARLAGRRRRRLRRLRRLPRLRRPLVGGEQRLRDPDRHH